MLRYDRRTTRDRKGCYHHRGWGYAHTNGVPGVMCQDVGIPVNLMRVETWPALLLRTSRAALLFIIWRQRSVDFLVRSAELLAPGPINADISANTSTIEPLTS